MRHYEILCQTVYRVEETIWHHACPHRGVMVDVEDEALFVEAIKDPGHQKVQGKVLHEETMEVLFRLVGVRRGLSGRCLALICEDVRTTNAVVLYTDVSIDGSSRGEILRAATSEVLRFRVTQTEKYWDRLRRLRSY